MLKVVHLRLCACGCFAGENKRSTFASIRSLIHIESAPSGLPLNQNIPKTEFYT